MYCVLPFHFINVICRYLFINVIFVVNPFGSYSTFAGADLKYPSLLPRDKSN